MKYEPTVAFIKDTAQIIQQYFHTGRHIRGYFASIPEESQLDRIIAHLAQAHLPLEYEQQPRSHTHILATEILGHSLAPSAFVTGLFYNPKS